MEFTKMQGAGNDYIYVNAFKEQVKDPVQTAIRVSDRHFGIGADGLVLICPSEKADFFMDIYNADGSRAKMCGNAIRCVAKYVYDRRMTDKTEIGYSPKTAGSRPRASIWAHRSLPRVKFRLRSTAKMSLVRN